MRLGKIKMLPVEIMSQWHRQMTNINIVYPEQLNICTSLMTNIMKGSRKSWTVSRLERKQRICTTSSRRADSVSLQSIWRI